MRIVLFLIGTYAFYQVKNFIVVFYTYVLCNLLTLNYQSFLLYLVCPCLLHKYPFNSLHYPFILIYERGDLTFVFSNLVYFA